MVEKDRGDSTQHIRARLIDPTLRAGSWKIAIFHSARPLRTSVIHTPEEHPAGSHERGNGHAVF